MAVSSGIITTGKYDGRYYQFEWSATASGANSIISYTLKSMEGAHTWYVMSQAELNISYTKGSGPTSIQLLSYNTDRAPGRGEVLTSGSFTVYHDSNSNASLTMTVRGAIYNWSINVSGSGTYDLPQRYTACSAPTSITTSYSSRKKGESATISWSGAKAGNALSISKYQVQRQINSGSWNNYTQTTSTSFSYTFNENKNTTVRFRVQTLASISGYDSGYSNSVSISIVNSPPTTSITTVTASSGELFNSATGEFAGSMTPRFTLSSSDADGDSLTYYYSTNNNSWTSNGNSSIFNLSKITSSTTFYFRAWDGTAYSSTVSRTLTLRSSPSSSYSASGGIYTRTTTTHSYKGSTSIKGDNTKSYTYCTAISPTFRYTVSSSGGIGALTIKCKYSSKEDFTNSSTITVATNRQINSNTNYYYGNINILSYLSSSIEKGEKVYWKIVTEVTDNITKAVTTFEDNIIYIIPGFESTISEIQYGNNYNNSTWENADEGSSKNRLAEKTFYLRVPYDTLVSSYTITGSNAIISMSQVTISGNFRILRCVLSVEPTGQISTFTLNAILPNTNITKKITIKIAFVYSLKFISGSILPEEVLIPFNTDDTFSFKTNWPGLEEDINTLLKKANIEPDDNNNFKYYMKIYTEGSISSSITLNLSTDESKPTGYSLKKDSSSNLVWSTNLQTILEKILFQSSSSISRFNTTIRVQCNLSFKSQYGTVYDSGIGSFSINIKDLNTVNANNNNLCKYTGFITNFNSIQANSKNIIEIPVGSNEDERLLIEQTYPVFNVNFYTTIGGNYTIKIKEVFGDNDSDGMDIIQYNYTKNVSSIADLSMSYNDSKPISLSLCSSNSLLENAENGATKKWKIVITNTVVNDTGIEKATENNAVLYRFTAAKVSFDKCEVSSSEENGELFTYSYTVSDNGFDKNNPNEDYNESRTCNYNFYEVIDNPSGLLSSWQELKLEDNKDVSTKTLEEQITWSVKSIQMIVTSTVVFDFSSKGGSSQFRLEKSYLTNSLVVYAAAPTVSFHPNQLFINTKSIVNAAKEEKPILFVEGANNLTSVIIHGINTATSTGARIVIDPGSGKIYWAYDDESLDGKKMSLENFVIDGGTW